MPLLHDPACRESLRTRLNSLSPGTPRKWGSMSVDQMLWHVGDGLEMALGRRDVTHAPTRIPRVVLRFMVMTLPWPRGAPTMPELVAKASHDFDAERARCLSLIDEMAGRELSGTWANHPLLGPMNGADMSRLQAKHIDHHLKQFGA